MTVAELSAIPDGMDFDTYVKLVDRRKKLWKKMSALSMEVKDCNYAMMALDDERGSDRWRKWQEKKEKFVRDLNAVNDEYDSITKTIAR